MLVFEWGVRLASHFARRQTNKIVPKYRTLESLAEAPAGRPVLRRSIGLHEFRCFWSFTFFSKVSTCDFESPSGFWVGATSARALLFRA